MQQVYFNRNDKDPLTVHLSLDDEFLCQLLKEIEEQPEEIKEKVKAAWKECQRMHKRKVEEVLEDEGVSQEVKKLCKDKVGDVDPSSLKAESLAMLFRLLTLYHLYRLKQTCRSGSLAKAFEPLLITDEMREIAATVGITLQLKAAYDSEKFRLVELFFINRDGGGIEPLKKYDDVIDEMHIEDDTSDCTVEDGHQHGGDNAKTDVTQIGEQSKILVLGFDPKLELKPSTETNVRTLFNPVKLTRQRGKQYDILQVVMAMTDRIQHILSSRLEILALLGFVRYLLTVVGDEDGTQSFPELEEQLFSHGEQIPLITTAYNTMSLQARSLLLCQISKRQQTDSDIRYLALAKSKAQSVHSQPDIESLNFFQIRKFWKTSWQKHNRKSHI
ncbi:uncharacterized protein [Ptychodera flava]|uniref:uncharacterized protein n=1 Tax=Ptychodera flava TaxID=63121 RepID=UPI00396A6E90